MLEGPHGIRIPEYQRAAALCRPDTVGDNAVRREITASDHISRSRRADCDALLLQERTDVAVGHQLRAGFGVGIRIIAIQPVRLHETGPLLAVLIDLVGSDVQEGADAGALPHAFTDVHCAHDVCSVGHHRFPVGKADNGLGRHVQHEFRLRLAEHLHKMSQIPDIARHGTHSVLQFQKFKK